MKQVILVALLLVGCSATSPTQQWPTPSEHPYWEYDSIQGLYSDPKCPGQYPFYGDDPGNGTRYFLYCWGHKE